ncbi:hypothetical protein SAMN05660484_02224 [Eubacterium ruminantium]|uniref:Uncharacterized protein n=2 Tax=Eubacterium ruminantium TaxID=42322 RepID=A0A1T4Q579_9FIRM|nr:hypothetical protein SAMN05660484_02224 [Eubacterium ruminantium]SDN30906.1 hypothetical protein SAMN04490370_11646 [Eubacterium ruminantium]SJZ98707.1 hypothetical protein SAMN02745110_02259 [Eubacterium ruminantium]
MKTTKIQFNATTFKATRNVISAYFGATFDRTIELDKAKKATKSYSDCIRTDEEELIKLALGQTEGIVRSKSDIEKSLATNKATYNKLIAPYNAMVTATDKAIADGVALFNNKDSALYKAYAEYVLNPTDDAYLAYADALAKRFVEFGLADATAENVQHYMVNADRFRKGSSAVKSGKIIDALAPKAFSEAILRKIYDNNKSAFNSTKFADYVRKCAEKAKKNA